MFCNKPQDIQRTPVYTLRLKISELDLEIRWIPIATGFTEFYLGSFKKEGWIPVQIYIFSTITYNPNKEHSALCQLRKLNDINTFERHLIDLTDILCNRMDLG